MPQYSAPALAPFEQRKLGHCAGRRPHLLHEGRAHPPRVRPLPRGPPDKPPVLIFFYMKSFTLEKIISKLTG